MAVNNFAKSYAKEKYQNIYIINNVVKYNYQGIVGRGIFTFKIEDTAFNAVASRYDNDITDTILIYNIIFFTFIPTFCFNLY